MSVDHYDCCCCNRTGVYEEFIFYCEHCGIKICDDCIIYENGNTNTGYLNENGYVIKKCCPACSGNLVLDRHRVSFLIKYLKEKYQEIITKDIIDKIILTER